MTTDSLTRPTSFCGDILTHLKPSIEAGTPVVGLEPSCLAVFRDEMLDLRPHDQDAKRLHGQVFTLAEFLTQHDYQPPRLHQDIVVHGHCHQKAIISLDAEKKLFEAMGAKAEILDDGCCGMAGSFGFEQHKYDLSMQVYEHQLGPRLREPASREAGRWPMASVARRRSSRRPAGARCTWRSFCNRRSTGTSASGNDALESTGVGNAPRG